MRLHLPQTTPDPKSPPDVAFAREKFDLTARDGPQAFVDREIMDIKAAANYLGVSRSHLSHILAGKVSGVPAIPHVRAGRRALIRRVVIDRWLLEQEHGVDARMAQ
jgi:hypothetical protein